MWYIITLTTVGAWLPTDCAQITETIAASVGSETSRTAGIQLGDSLTLGTEYTLEYCDASAITLKLGKGQSWGAVGETLVVKNI